MTLPFCFCFIFIQNRERNNIAKDNTSKSILSFAKKSESEVSLRLILHNSFLANDGSVFKKTFDNTGDVVCDHFKTVDCSNVVANGDDGSG